jgi:hypothetical protein
MALSLATTGSAGVIGWVVFVARDGAWKLALARLRDYRPWLHRLGSDLLVVTPIYRKRDPNCCPSGGAFDRIFRWNGRKFMLRYAWRQNP